MPFDDHRFEILYQISKKLNAAFYQETLLKDALDLVIQVVNAERGLVAQYHTEKNDFAMITARHVKQQDIIDLSAFSSGLLRQVLEKQKPCLYHDVQSDPRLSQLQSVQIHAIKSVIAVPIFSEGNFWGVILVDSRENRAAFTEDNLRFLDFFSNLVSLALDKIIRLEKLQDENLALKNQLQSVQKVPNLIGESPAMRKLAALIHKVAVTDATALLLGESGTGKDLAAQAIHHLSPRRSKPYLAQFCGSIPDTLLESELFGYKKGAFTGATSDKKGLFEVADGGTFFLDEIADISLALQAKLLRVIQNREIIRLGDTQVKKVDVRLIAATNKNLKQLVKEGGFREDLYYRLNVFPITIPPLRERSGDIPLLAKHFVARYGGEDIALPDATIGKLQNYSWPGNVRQLENVLQRSLILCDGRQLLPEHVTPDETEPEERFSSHGTLQEFEKRLLKQRLDEYGGNRTQTAKSLGVSVRWVQKKLKEMENPPEDQSSGS
jgi:Nif-specific regulatory protein